MDRQSLDARPFRNIKPLYSIPRHSYIGFSHVLPQTKLELSIGMRLSADLPPEMIEAL
jgi:hypothetical protein